MRERERERERERFCVSVCLCVVLYVYAGASGLGARVYQVSVHVCARARARARESVCKTNSILFHLALLRSSCPTCVIKPSIKGKWKDVSIGDGGGCIFPDDDDLTMTNTTSQCTQVEEANEGACRETEEESQKLDQGGEVTAYPDWAPKGQKMSEEVLFGLSVTGSMCSRL